MSKRKLYDSKCGDLAEHFLSDHPWLKTLTRAEYYDHERDLAELIQGCIEDYLAMLPEEGEQQRAADMNVAAE